MTRFAWVGLSHTEESDTLPLTPVKLESSVVMCDPLNEDVRELPAGVTAPIAAPPPAATAKAAPGKGACRVLGAAWAAEGWAVPWSVDCWPVRAELVGGSRCGTCRYASCSRPRGASRHAEASHGVGVDCRSRGVHRSAA